MNRITEILLPYRNRVEKLLKESITSLGAKTPLRDACEYALSTEGKRFRPALVLMIADALGKNLDVGPVALAVEYFHTSSLIADDLPCMDNEEERRNRPTVHKAFGETTALLASYALIASGYHYLAKNAQLLKNTPFADEADHRAILALENGTYNTGILGATGGQFLDLYPPDISLETIKEVLHKKTVTLFEISFVLGWLYGGGSCNQLSQVKQAASHFGMAFQIADDIGDMDQDKVNGRLINIANVLGKEKAQKLFFEEVASYKACLKQLDLEHSPLMQLVDAII